MKPLEYCSDKTKLSYQINDKSHPTKSSLMHQNCSDIYIKGNSCHPWAKNMHFPNQNIHATFCDPRSFWRRPFMYVQLLLLQKFLNPSPWCGAWPGYFPKYKRIFKRRCTLLPVMVYLLPRPGEEVKRKGCILWRGDCNSWPTYYSSDLPSFWTCCM